MKKLLYSFVAVVTAVSLSSAPVFAATATQAGGSGHVPTAPLKACQLRVDLVNKSINDQATQIDANYNPPSNIGMYATIQPKDLTGKKVTVRGSKYKNTDDKKDPRNNQINYPLLLQRFDGALAQANSMVYISGDKKGKAAFDTAQLTKDVGLLRNSVTAGKTLSEAARTTLMPGYIYTKGHDYGVNLGLAGWKSDEKHISPNTFTVELNKDKCSDKTYQQNMVFLSKQRAIVVRALKKHRNTTIKQNTTNVSNDYKKIVDGRNKIRKQIAIKQ